MKSKILVIDDSLTIQKVIRITLSTKQYEIVECHKYEDISSFLRSDFYDLVLYDFGLTEKIDGLALGKEIKKQSQSSKIIAMLGAFDSVDDLKFEDAGIDEKIVKPFESNYFIKVCEKVLLLAERDRDDSEDILSERDNGLSLNDSNSGGDIKEDDEEQYDDWKLDLGEIATTEKNLKEIDVDSSFIKFKKEDKTEKKVDKNVNSSQTLKNALEDWGMEIPSIILSGQQKENRHSSSAEQFEATLSSMLIPPIIASERVSDTLKHEDTSVTKIELSSVDRLDDIDVIDDISNIGDDSISFSDNEMENEFFVEQVSEKTEEKVETTTEEKIEEKDNDKESYNVSLDREEFLNDSLNTQEDFWSVEKNDEKGNFEVGAMSESDDRFNFDSYRVHENSEPTFSNPLCESSGNSADKSAEALVNTSLSSDDIDKIVQQLQHVITPMVEKIIKDNSNKIIEKVSWEVIPDLAENLIKKEIQRLSGMSDPA